MRAIETEYNGWRFRSRLEARWAVCFDAMGVPYEYEPETLDLGNQGWYLPDFYLPGTEMWAEVKPKAISRRVFHKLLVAACEVGKPILMLIGPPDMRPYYGLVPLGDNRVVVKKHSVTTAAGVATMRATRFEWNETPTQNKVREIARGLWSSSLPIISRTFQDDLSFKQDGLDFEVIR